MKGIDGSTCLPSVSKWVNAVDGQSTLPTWNPRRSTRRRLDRPARSTRLAAPLGGAAARAAPGGPAERFARCGRRGVIPSASSSLPSSAATRSCSR